MADVIQKNVKGRNTVSLVVNRNLRQRFHVRVGDINGRILLSSEKYRNKEDALKLYNRILGGLRDGGE